MSAHYPEITASKLLPFRIVIDALTEDPGYLDDPDCPYSPDVRDFLKRFIAADLPLAVPAATRVQSVDDLINISGSEIVKLYNDVTTVETGGDKLTPSEKLQLFKTRQTLLDRIVTLGERSAGLKQVNVFRKLLLDFIDDNFTASQREALMEQIRRQVDGRSQAEDVGRPAEVPAADPEGAGT